RATQRCAAIFCRSESPSSRPTGRPCTAAARSSWRTTGPTRARRRRGGGWICAPSSSGCGSSVRARSWRRRSGAPAAPRSRARASTGRRSLPTTRSSRPGSPPGCSATRTGGNASSVELMALDTAGVDRALGAIGTTFRLTRLYPPSHPAVAEALRRVASGGIPPADATLGRVTLSLGRRSAVRLERLPTPTPGQDVPAVPDTALPAAKTPPVASVPEAAAAKRGSQVFRPDVLPPDVEAHRAIGVLKAAATPEEQQAAIQTLNALAPGLLERRDVTTVAEAIAILDRL